MLKYKLYVDAFISFTKFVIGCTYFLNILKNYMYCMELR